jgi:hypothetical protein
LIRNSSNDLDNQFDKKMAQVTITESLFGVTEDKIEVKK